MMGDGKKSAAKSSPLPARVNTHYPLPVTHYLLVATLLAGALGGCGTVAKRDTPSVSKAPRGGGYYLDDGPGANPPANLDSIPDAVPRIEPLHRGAARPYVVMGRHYTPMTALQPYKARGVATWYGRRYHGRQTSSGERYDMYGMTGAHTTLPIPSYARVTNLSNGRSVIVRINDRGPFIGERLIDLSYAAAYRLGLVADGSSVVEVESIRPGDAVAATSASAPAQRSAVPPVNVAAPEPDPEAAPLPAAEPQPAVAVPQIPLTVAENGIYLQLGAFASRENAENYLTRLRLQVAWLAERLQVYPRDGLFRVRAGPYASQAEARQIAERVGQALGIKPILLTR
ncbi:MAG: septal ring lytic transglycosylase RlpA family protein [Betaproteobacteria bacterium]|nr:septal ring lytic transglycosylase RlpA family protein [Betaproteobacteria bacterium]